MIRQLRAILQAPELSSIKLGESVEVYQPSHSSLPMYRSQSLKPCCLDSHYSSSLITPTKLVSSST